MGPALLVKVGGIAWSLAVIFVLFLEGLSNLSAIGITAVASVLAAIISVSAVYAKLRYDKQRDKMLDLQREDTTDIERTRMIGERTDKLLSDMQSLYNLNMKEKDSLIGLQKELLAQKEQLIAQQKELIVQQAAMLAEKRRRG